MTPDFPLDRRRLLQAAAAWGVAASGVAQAAAPSRDLSGVTLRVGTYKGLWRPLLTASGQADTPYKIDWRELNNGVLHIEAINGDALDLGSGSEIPPVFAARQKSSVRLVAVTHEDLNNQATLARKDSAIRSIADLKGKRVGYVRATTSHYYLAKQLAEAGLSFADIQPVSLTPADGLSAFARGDLDAWAIYGYNGQLARTQYGARTLKTGVGYLSGNFPIYANPRALDDTLRRAAGRPAAAPAALRSPGSTATSWPTPARSRPRRACPWATWSSCSTAAAATTAWAPSPTPWCAATRTWPTPSRRSACSTARPM